MSEQNSPENNEPQNGGGAGMKIAMLAGVLGLAVGAGLYAFSGGNDKPVAGQTPIISANAEQAGEGKCVFSQAMREKLDNAAGGAVAGFSAIDRAYSVAGLSFVDKDGTKKALADWKGRTVLLNLWATWCPPCRAEMPSLDQLQKELGSEKFEVVTVSVDTGADTKPKKFFTKIGIADLGFFHDPEISTLSTLKRDGLAFGLPATMLVGKDGCTLGTLNGPAEWASEDAKKLIKAAL